ncbi:hypothetical protein [Vulcanisaeta sp. JCM 14467]|uniref:hypothetical protein n=1 Tax=Vulcanisaeta sp. JCM 14467 TaxID=1295370 RepID=UPI000AABBAF5|nr:hypothetical protein [Vulcanisaeta sp. JCM 14467]
MNKIGKLYRINSNVEVRGRIGKLYPAYKHPWVIELGGEGSTEVKDGGGEGRDHGGAGE